MFRRCLPAGLVLLALAGCTGSRPPTGPIDRGASRPGYGCPPGGGHPYPVLLLPGTLAPAVLDFAYLRPVLVRAGYCTVLVDYGLLGTAPIPRSAAELASAVDRVLESTGARRVLLVAHSQGGLVARWWLRFLGGDRVTAGLVGLAPPDHGTSYPLAVPAAGVGCAACAEMATGSALLATLNRGGDTVPGVRYTIVVSALDPVVLPYRSALLHGPLVTDVVVQQRCPGDPVGHDDLSFDPVVAQWVLNALAGDGQADPAFRPRCHGFTAAGGGPRR